jgi:DNA-directed RNA polymerase subunit RPC12/RpoP
MPGARKIRLGLPLDSRGLLRRECPQCHRQFKVALFADGTDLSPGKTLTCPYCAAARPRDQFFTKEQGRHATETVSEKAVAPLLDQLVRNLESMNRPGSPVRFETKRSPRRPVRSLTERDDMDARQCGACGFSFAIAPGDEGAVRCPACGEAQ